MGGDLASRVECTGSETVGVRGWRAVCENLSMLRLVLPKGSLESATLELFAGADLSVIARL